MTYMAEAGGYDRCQSYTVAEEQHATAALLRTFTSMALYIHTLNGLLLLGLVTRSPLAAAKAVQGYQKQMCSMLVVLSSERGL
jgi:hypothetical protein